MNAKAIRSLLVLLTLLSPWGAVHALDTDGGLVSDVWEDYYGYGDLVHDADDDGDGVTNLWEYYFNLNPFVRDSHYLTITPVSSTLITVYFTAPFGQRFQWITTDDLVMGTWTALQGEITGTGNLSTLMEDPTGIQKRFYRVTPLGALDQDDDGLDAHEEFLLGTSDILSDSDGDLVSDSDEYVIHSDPVNAGVSGGLFAGTSQTISSAFQNTSGTTNNYTVQVSGDEVETSDPTYSFVTSTQPGSGVTYTWQEISATGTLLSQISSALDDYEEVALTFSFPFYGQSHSSIFVSSNGYITLNAGSFDYENYGSLPNNLSPPALIAPFFDDLFPDTGGDIYFQDFTTYAIIQWTGVYPYSDGSGDSHFTFQVMIDDAGTIEFRYQNMVGDVTSATVGLQNEERTTGTNVAHNEPFITNGLAVRLTPVPPVTATWFTVSPLSFSLSDGQTQQLDIQLNPPANFFGGAEGMISIIENGSGATVDTFSFSLGMLLTDADGDWVDDTYEAQSGMNNSLNDADGDEDGDGLSNRFEFNMGLKADSTDSDNDLLPDAWEVQNGLDGTSPDGVHGGSGDFDGDTYTNLEEYQGGTDPKNIIEKPYRVTHVKPIQGETSVANDAVIVISLDRPLEQVYTLTDAVVEDYATSTPVAGTLTVLPGDQSLAWIPDQEFPVNSRLKVTVKPSTTGIPLTWHEGEFRTRPQNTVKAPFVFTSSPENRNINVLTDATLSVTWSEPIDSSINLASGILLLDASGSPVAHSYSVDDLYYRLDITPLTPLHYGETYTLTLLGHDADPPSGPVKTPETGGNNTPFKDLQGYLMSESYSITFTAIEEDLAPPSVGPYVISTIPQKLGTDLSKSTDIAIVWNEPMNASTFTSSSVQLVSPWNGEIIASSLSYDSPTNTLTITPNSDLSYDTAYQVTFSETVLSQAAETFQDQNWFLQFRIEKDPEQVPPPGTPVPGPGPGPQPPTSPAPPVGNPPPPGGSPPPSQELYLIVSVGDQSGSQSENWTVIVGGQLVGPAPPGPVLTFGTLCFTRGEEYEMYLSHNGSNLSSPDYDWHLKVEKLGTRTLHLIDDPDNLVANHGNGPNDPNYAERIATLMLPLIEKIRVDGSDTDSHYLGEDMNEDFIATVKGTGNVTMKTDILPDTPFVKNNLVWSGGVTVDFADKSLATVSRGTSQKFDINLSVTGTDEFRDLETWVIWAENTLFKTIAPDPQDMDIDYEGTGFTYGIGSNNPVANGCAIEFTVSPNSVKDLTDKFPSVKFDIKRTKETNGWKAVSNSPYLWTYSGLYDAPGTDDDGPPTGNADEDLMPSETGKIYSIDYPGIFGLPLPGEVEYFYKGSFVEWVNITFNGNFQNGIRASNNFEWHSMSRAEVVNINGELSWNRARHFEDDNVIGTGSITVGNDPSPY